MLVTSETKIDDSFPVIHFLLGGYTKFYRLDRNSNGCDICFTLVKIYRQKSYISLKQDLKVSLLN